MPVEVKEENGRITTIYTPEVMDYNRVEGADYEKPFCLQGNFGGGPHEINVVMVVKENGEEMVKFFDGIGHEEYLGTILEGIENGTMCAYEIHGIHP
jgi:hypothetical protein